MKSESAESMLKIRQMLFLCMGCWLCLFGNILPLKAERRPLSHYAPYEAVVSESEQRRILSYLADDQARGRQTGTWANEMVATYIRHEMEDYGLLPFFNGGYTQRFMVDSLKGFNIAGWIPAKTPTDEYLVISAHYDHLGAINGYVYNGADDNASGVTAMLNLAKIYALMAERGEGPGKNLIFVAFDAKERSMAGSQFFVRNLGIPTKKILCNLNLDQIGSILEPVQKAAPEFIIVLGEHTLPKGTQRLTNSCNRIYKLGLDVNHTFYGSENFTEIIYDLSDQASFRKVGIPALLFTSGFTQHTYKTTDDVQYIDFDVLRLRTLLVFYFIQHFVQHR